jgi:hypothetical protein
MAALIGSLTTRMVAKTGSQSREQIDLLRRPNRGVLGVLLDPLIRIKLDELMSYRGVHVLGDVRNDDESGKFVLMAKYFASCLVAGPDPMWGLWTADGNFKRFYNFKRDIIDSYPKLIWRRKMCAWNIFEVADYPTKVRRERLKIRYMEQS